MYYRCLLVYFDFWLASEFLVTWPLLDLHACYSLLTSSVLFPGPCALCLAIAIPFLTYFGTYYLLTDGLDFSINFWQWLSMSYFPSCVSFTFLRDSWNFSLVSRSVWYRTSAFFLFLWWHFCFISDSSLLSVGGAQMHNTPPPPLHCYILQGPILISWLCIVINNVLCTLWSTIFSVTWSLDTPM